MLFRLNCYFPAVRLIQLRNCSTNTNKSYSSTVLLPKTRLPLRLNKNKLIERQQELAQVSAFEKLYDWQYENNKGSEFVLHDGPPYANGVPHMGHAINKILKDSIVRHKILQGHKVHYVPGWDCHGLPIEMKANDSLTELSAIEIREKAKKFAQETIEMQKKTFKSWGVMADWNNSYLTFDNSYIKNQLRQFYNLYKKKLIYRDVKPIFWSPSSRSALAEAELEYVENHKSKAITLKVEVDTLPSDLQLNNHLTYSLIWTTTPWTLPSNQAIIYNPKLNYVLVQKPNGNENYIIAEELLGKLSKDLQCEFIVLKRFSGDLLHGATYKHPVYKNQTLPFLPGSFATATKGTGLVHAAPAHGPDDFLIALQNNIPIICLVDKTGCYTTEAGEDLHGLSVLDKGNDLIISKLDENIIFKENYTHSYPYDWRTKQPVIIRANKQWFIDTKAIRDKALELIEHVRFFPKFYGDMYKGILMSQVKNRPYWCISRQRCWGVPIPVFYKKDTGETIINEDIIEHFCKLIDKHGGDYWWTVPLEELFPETIRNTLGLTLESVEKGKDILDIWLDSGLSWSHVLKGDQIADLYLEGIDQFRGWFQSSLMTSVALREQSPYKAIYVHGFAVDKNGLKMSKSIGNVIDPIDVVNVYGIDVLRWWVVCHASRDSTTQISETVLQASAEEVQKIRSTLRFALGALSDYNPEEFDYNSLPLIDKYMLHLIWNFDEQINELKDQYNFSKFSSTVIYFLTNPVSALYYTAIKDRLYCNFENDSWRRASQFVLFNLLGLTLKGIAPILPHLAQEFYMYSPFRKTDSFFQNRWNSLEIWKNEKVVALVEDVILNIRKGVNKAEESSTLDLKINIKLSSQLVEDFKAITDLNLLIGELVDILQVSQVEIEEDSQLTNDLFSFLIEQSNLNVCNRCRKFSSKTKNVLCTRCLNVVSKFDIENKLSN